VYKTELGKPGGVFRRRQSAAATALHRCHGNGEDPPSWILLPPHFRRLRFAVRRTAFAVYNIWSPFTMFDLCQF